MNPESADLLVVGAGPAGSTTAISALRSDPSLRVVVCDKSTFPRDKVCGDGIGPGVVSVLEALGIQSVVEKERPIEHCRVVGPRGSGFITELPDIRGKTLVGYVIPRLEFDNRLVTEARGAGADIREGWRFTRLVENSGEAVTAEFDTPDGPRLIRADALVAADGANSRVRNELGVGRNSDRLTGIAIRSYSDVISSGDGPRALMFEWSEEILPAYAWYFPGSGSSVNVGLGMVIRDRKRKKIDLKDHLLKFHGALRTTGTQLTPPERTATYILPHGARMPRLVHGRCILIGDAGSMINPLSGEGIFYGMAAGMEVGTRFASAGRTDPAASLRAAEHEIRDRFAGHFKSNFVASVLLRSRGWAAISIRAASRDESVLKGAAELLFGEGTLKLGTAVRILVRGLRR